MFACWLPIAPLADRVSPGGTTSPTKAGYNCSVAGAKLVAFGSQPPATSMTTDWEELTSRRREILATAAGHFPDETFACGELNSHLADDTTTRTLNKLAREDEYLRRYPGGSTMLLAVLEDVGETDAEFTLSSMERLAQKMVNREGLPLDPSSVDWSRKTERFAFVNEFNTRADDTRLRATWTRNKYEFQNGTLHVVEENT